MQAHKYVKATQNYCSGRAQRTYAEKVAVINNVLDAHTQRAVNEMPERFHCFRSVH